MILEYEQYTLTVRDRVFGRELEKKGRDGGEKRMTEYIDTLQCVS